MATLASLSKIQSPSGRGMDALAVMLSDPMFAFFEQNGGIWQQGATTNRWTPYTDAITLGARALNGAITADTYSPGTEQSDTLAIHTGGHAADISYIRDSEKGIATFDFARDEKMKFKKWVAEYKAKLFDSDGSSNTIKGLKKILDGTGNIPGYSTKRLMNAVNPTSVENATATAKSLDIITDATKDEALYEVMLQAGTYVENATVQVMNQTLWAKVSVILYRKGIQINSFVNDFGVRYEQFNGLTVMVVPDTVITCTEPDDTSTPVNKTTSIYILSPGEDRLSLITNSGLEWIDFDHQENTEKNLEKWEIRANWRIADPKSILRVRNIKVTA